jgi:hypothetical protein
MLVAGDVSAGREVSRARAPDGSEVVKFWARVGADLDIEEIWRSETRQLQRLAAIPRQHDVLQTIPIRSSFDSDMIQPRPNSIEASLTEDRP